MTKGNFGKLVKEQRDKIGLTAEGLAKKAGIDRTYISKIENHDYLPSPAIYMKIIKALQLDQGAHLLPYIRNKFPEYASFRRFMAKEGRKIPLNIIPAPETDTPRDTKAKILRTLTLQVGRKEGMLDNKFAVNLVKTFKPSKVNDKKYMDRVKQSIKKMRKGYEDFMNEKYNLADFISRE